MWEQNEPKEDATAGGAIPLPKHLPKPSAWPASMALAVTLLAFAVVTNWIMAIAGLCLLLFSVGGWFEDLRNDPMQ